MESFYRFTTYQDVRAQGELKPGFRSNAAMCSQTSLKVAFVQ